MEVRHSGGVNPVEQARKFGDLGPLVLDLSAAAREVLFRVLGRTVNRSSGLKRAGLKPMVKLGRSHSLAIDGFFDPVAAERVAVHRDVSVAQQMYSHQSPLTAEIAGAWLAAVLLGRADPPPRQEQEAHADAYPLVRRTGSMSSTKRCPG